MESTQTLMQFIQFSWQGDPQLLVEGQSFKPVFQLLERRTGGGGRESREGTQRGWGLKQENKRLLRDNMEAIWQQRRAPVQAGRGGI